MKKKIDIDEEMKKMIKESERKEKILMKKVNELAKEIFSRTSGDIITISILQKSRRFRNRREKRKTIKGIFITRKEVMGTTKFVKKGDSE